MIIVIRISGLVEVPEKVQETLFRMRLRRKYCAVILPDSEESDKLLKKVRNFVAFGKLNKETLIELLTKRAKSIGNKKIDAKSLADSIEKAKSINLSPFGIKPFFRLHPPRKGIETKTHFPIGKGVLGDNKEKINDLVRRML